MDHRVDLLVEVEALGECLVELEDLEDPLVAVGVLESLGGL